MYVANIALFFLTGNFHCYVFHAEHIGCADYRSTCDSPPEPAEAVVVQARSEWPRIKGRDYCFGLNTVSKNVLFICFLSSKI